MGLRKDVKKILEILEPFEKDIMLKAKKYVELTGQVETIKFSVKSITHYIDEKGDYAVKIEYAMPAQMITQDYEKNIVCSDMFKNINYLNMVSFDDMEKITRAVEYMKEKNKR